MTADEVADWERELLAGRDLGDLACCVQLLRTLGWSTVRFGSRMKGGMLWYEDLHEFGPVIAQLEAIADNNADDAPVARSLARLFGIVHDALQAGPRVPDEAELVRRFSAGELGDRTVRCVLNLGPWEFIELCQRHGAPPIQLGGDHD